MASSRKKERFLCGVVEGKQLIKPQKFDGLNLKAYIFALDIVEWAQVLSLINA